MSAWGISWLLELKELAVVTCERREKKIIFASGTFPKTSYHNCTELNQSIYVNWLGCGNRPSCGTRPSCESDISWNCISTWLVFTWPEKEQSAVQKKGTFIEWYSFKRALPLTYSFKKQVIKGFFFAFWGDLIMTTVENYVLTDFRYRYQAQPLNYRFSK